MSEQRSQGLGMELMGVLNFNVVHDSLQGEASGPATVRFMNLIYLYIVLKHSLLRVLSSNRRHWREAKKVYTRHLMWVECPLLGLDTQDWKGLRGCLAARWESSAIRLLE